MEHPCPSLPELEPDGFEAPFSPGPGSLWDEGPQKVPGVLYPHPGDAKLIFPPVPPEGINTKPLRAPNLCLFLFQVGFSPGWEQEPEPGVVFGVFFLVFPALLPHRVFQVLPGQGWLPGEAFSAITKHSLISQPQSTPSCTSSQTGIGGRVSPCWGCFHSPKADKFIPGFSCSMQTGPSLIAGDVAGHYLPSCLSFLDREMENLCLPVPAD